MIEMASYIIGGIIMVIIGLVKAIRAIRNRPVMISRIPIKEIRKQQDAEYERIKERYDEVYNPDSDISPDVQSTVDGIRKRRKKD
jgi:hypothetical protein